jgi:hypothetical protein
LLSRRGRSSPAKASGFDTHRDSITSRHVVVWAHALHHLGVVGGGGGLRIAVRGVLRGRDTGAAGDNGIATMCNLS